MYTCHLLEGVLVSNSPPEREAKRCELWDSGQECSVYLLT